MNEIVKKNNKYYFDIEIDESKLEYYTKKDILKVEYQKRYRIKKYLLKEPFGTLYARHYALNIFTFYYLDKNNKLKYFKRTIY